ncbi:MAG: hypothetical protein WBM40_20390 [Thiohalocapsa sp.]
MRKDPRRNFETAQDGILLINGITGAIEDVNPCLSCASHAFGQMPMVIDIQDASGQIIKRISRD